MATEEVTDPTNPTWEEMVNVLNGKLAAKEVQLTAAEIKIEKLSQALEAAGKKVVSLEKKLAKSE